MGVLGFCAQLFRAYGAPLLRQLANMFVQSRWSYCVICGQAEVFKFLFFMLGSCFGPG